MEFYPEVGVTRDVGSRPETKLYALRPLLSVRWLFIEENSRDQSPMPGYIYHSQQNGYNIYENENYLPMGFSYDYFVYNDELRDVATDSRGNLLLRAVALDGDTGDRNRDLLERLPPEDYYRLDPDRMAEDVATRRLYTADSFTIDNTGFTTGTSFDRERFLFFSVPWERGWSARVQVDGGGWQPLQIERANLGFMAVRAPAGNAAIRFDYRTPGLIAGAAVTAFFIIIVIIYCIILCRRKMTEESDVNLSRSLHAGEPVTLSWDEYQKAYGDREARAARMRDAFEAAAKARGRKPGQSLTGE
jgi:hypothetical protein